MNPKIQKYKDIIHKNDMTIEKCQAQNREMRKKVTELENLDIVGAVRASGYTIEELISFLKPEKEKEREEEQKIEEN